MGTRCFLIFISAMLIVIPAVNAQSTYIPESLHIKLHIDGRATVEYSVRTSTNILQTDIDLFGNTYTNVIITNENGLPLDFLLREGGISIDSLGSARVNILYVTEELVSKAGGVWTFSISSPLGFIVEFPRSSTIVGLSNIPLAIGDDEASYTLTMRSGDHEINYLAVLQPLGEEEGQAGIPIILIATALTVISALVIVGLAITRRRKGVKGFTKQTRQIDANKIIEAKPYLHPEDKEAIEFIASAGGEIFESELRDHFRLPRTTTWRLIKRLQREEIVEIKKVGRMNLVYLKD